METNLARAIASVALILLLSGCDTNAPTVDPPDVGTEPRVHVNNLGAGTIVTFRWSDCAATVWGGDRLGDGVIGPGDSRTFELDPGCYDFQAVNDAGVARQLMGQQAEAGRTIRFNVTD